MGVCSNSIIALVTLSIVCTQFMVVSQAPTEATFGVNLFTALTSSEVSARAHQSVALGNGRIVIVGTVTTPRRLVDIPSFVRALDLTQFQNLTDEKQTTAFVMLVTPNSSSIEWAVRTTYTVTSSKWSVAFDGDDIYLAGHATQYPIGLGTAECCKQKEGMIALKFSLDGDIKKASVLGNGTDTYNKIAISKDKLVLTGTICKNSVLLVGKDIPLPNDQSLLATDKSLAFFKFSKELNLLHWNPGSFSTNSEQYRVVRDTFWDSSISQDGSKLFLAVRRHILWKSDGNFVNSILGMYLMLDVERMLITRGHTMDRDLQETVRMASSPLDGSGFYSSYVSRVKNEQNVVLRYYTDDLEPRIFAPIGATTFKFGIEQDNLYPRTIATTVRDLIVDQEGNLHVLLFVAEILNHSIADYETHRTLKNGRAGVLTVTRNLNVHQIAQVQLQNIWEPETLLMDKNDYAVVGREEVTTPTTQERLLYSEVARKPIVLASSTPSSSPPKPHASATGGAANSAKPSVKATPKVSSGVGPTPTSTPTTSAPSKTPSPSASGNDVCIGASTRIGGRSIRDIVSEHPRLRIQLHPWRWIKSMVTWASNEVEMHCIDGLNGIAGDVFCATKHHVVRQNGKDVYMKDFCRSRMDCRTRLDATFNFKGECGDHVKIHDGLAISMHSGDDGTSPTDAVLKECQMRENNRLWWLLRTL